MNGRALLWAIAGIDEAYVLESEQAAAVGADLRAARKRKRQVLTAVGLAALICLAVFGAIRHTPPSFRLSAQSDAAGSRTDDPSASEHAETPIGPGTATEKDRVPTTGETASGSANTTELPNDTADHGPSASGPSDRQEERPAPETSSTTKAPPAEPTTANLTLPHNEPTTEQPTQAPPGGDPGGRPGAVYTTLNVSYSEAKERFAHPILPGSGSGFTGYQVGIVSRNGDVSAAGSFCLSVDYEYVNGTIHLQDQDRLTGSSASTLGEAYDYRGRTFYVQSPGDYGESCYRVGYYPTWDSGVAYEAVFDGDADVYEIMDRMIAVEIE